MDHSSGKNEQVDVGDISSFDDLKIPETLLRGIYSMGYEIPSAIQRKAIHPIVAGYDVIAQAQSGTGKTATFLIGAMSRADPASMEPQILVLCHNRELAIQIHFNFEGLNSYLKLKGGLFIGGTSVEDNLKEVEEGVQMIIGTPGRVLDLMNPNYQRKNNKERDRGGRLRDRDRDRDRERSSDSKLSLETIRVLVMDEADELLSRGFQTQIYDIFQSDLSSDAQVCIFSATMPQYALEVTRKFMKDPKMILVKDEEVTLEGIKQYYVPLKYDNWKTDTLLDLYKYLNINQTIIFVNTIKKAEQLKAVMAENKFDVACIHREMSQLERNRIMKDFRTGKSRVLIATDVIARGIDVQQVSIVINYELPRQEETYIHRIGRSGRYGRKGTAINFVTNQDMGFMKSIERFYDTKVERLPDNIGDLV